MTETSKGARLVEGCSNRAPAVLALLSVAMVAAAPLRGAELGDEGVMAMGGWRLLTGQVPVRDFFSLVPPLSFLAVACAYALLGVSVWAGRALALVYAAGLAAVSLRLCARLLERPLFRCAALAPLASCGVAAWLLPSHHWLADLLALSATAAFLAALSGRAFSWSAAGGASAAACASCLQDQGGILVLAIAFWIAFAAPSRSRPRLAAGAICGAAAVAGALALWLLPKVPAASMLDDWLLFPLAHYRSLPRNAPGMGSALSELASLWHSGLGQGHPAALAFWIAKVALALAAIPAGAAALVWLGRSKSEHRIQAALLAAACLAFLVQALRRPAPVNWEWALPPFALASAWGLERWHDGPARRTRWLAAAAACLALAVFLGAALVRVPGLFCGDGVMVHAPAGRLGPVAPHRAADLQGLVDELAASLKPGEPLFSSGFISMVNLLTLHPNPAPLDVFVPPAYTSDAQVDRVTAALDLRKSRWVVQPAAFSGGERWDGYLRERFRPVWANAGFELWELRGARDGDDAP